MIQQLQIAVLTALLTAGSLAAQGTASQALLMAMSANGKQMMSYQWKQKITVYRRGNPAEPIIEEIRLDADGQPHRVTLARPEEKRMGPLRARKAAEIRESIQEVMRLAGRYAAPQQIAGAIRRGEVWESSGRLRVQSRAVILPTDDMTILVNSANYLATRININTQHDGAPVTIVIDYEVLPGGPSMMSRMTVGIPRDGIVVNVESFDFVRLAGSMIP